jgi:hypothetical protein
VNIEDPTISRYLAEKIQWLPLASRQFVIERAKNLESVQELDELIAAARQAGPER